MVPPPERTEYLYELRAVAKNISRERCAHLEVHPPQASQQEVDIHECAVQVTNGSKADNICGVSIPEAAEVVQPRVEP